jgi:hypothetical protein
MPSHVRSIPFGAGLLFLLAACGGAPGTAQSMSLSEASFSQASVIGSQTVVDGGTVISLTISLGIDPQQWPCPVVDKASASLNGVAVPVVSPGAVGTACEADWSLGLCSGNTYPVCNGPSWSITSPPSGPLTLVIGDSSKTLTFDVADMGTRRAVSVARLVDASDAGAASPGQATLTWTPMADAVDGWAPAKTNFNGYTSSEFGVTTVVFQGSVDGGSYEIDWNSSGGSFPDNVSAAGANLTMSAVGGFATLNAGTGWVPWPTPGPVVAGTFTVSSTSFVPTARCDLPECIAMFTTAVSTAATWKPF